MSDDNQFRLPGKAEQPEEKPRLDGKPAPNGTVWLTQWKGRKHKTKKQRLAAACQHCGRDYVLNGVDLNELAEQQGAWKKTVRGANLVAAVSTVWDIDSKKAGKQLRHTRNESMLDEGKAAKEQAVRFTVCPTCKSDQVLIESP